MYNERFSLKPLSLSGSFLSFVFLFYPTASAHGDVTVGAPSSTTVKACDDYFTQELNNPADMSDSADVNNYFLDQDITGFSAKAISGGLFTATTTADSTTKRFQLWSPFVCGSYPIGGRFGAKVSSGFKHVINFTPTLAAKYNKIHVRMFHPSVTFQSGYGVRVRAERDCSYNNKTSLSAVNFLKEGWHTYTFDMTQTPSAGDTTAWAAGDVTGLAIEPTQQASAQIKVDWVRLEDSTSCSTAATVPYDATITNNNNLISFYIDDNSDPFDGYQSKLSSVLLTGATSSSVALSNLSGVAPGSYRLVAVQDSDFATTELTNPWDFGHASDSGNGDVTAIGGISNATFSGGQLSGTTDHADSTIFMNLGNSGVNASRYGKLSIKISGPTIGNPATPVRILWDTGFKDLRTTDGEYQGGGLWHVNLSAMGTWTGTPTNFIVRPAIVGGAEFSLDFVSLRSSGFDTTRTVTSPQFFVSGTQLRVNAPPTGLFTKPSFHSGESLRPWNMNPGDFVTFSNLRGDADPDNAGEAYTSFLPDVRKIDGLRGDFFKGANVAGNGDPNNHSVFPAFSETPLSFSSSDYKLLCYRMLIDKGFSLRDGSHGRVLWENETSGYSSEDLVAIYDHWSSTRWYEYCMDMKTLPIDGSLTGAWNGTISKFRVDSHEWSHSFLNDDITVPPNAEPISVKYYFDYIKLKKHPVARGKLTFAFQTVDSDDTSVTQKFFYTTTRGVSGGTEISSGALSCQGRVCVFNTAAVPAGTYYLYSSVADAHGTTFFGSDTPFVVEAQSSSLGAPVLSLESPSSSRNTMCDTLQIKGFALQAESDTAPPVTAVQVFVDGTFLALLDPSEYSPAAKAAYPSLDSSNVGFSQLVSAANLANGAHTVRVIAYGLNGLTAESSFTVTKQSAGCPDPIVDPDPQGAPVSAGVDPSTPTPVPTSGPVIPSQSRLKVSHTSAGVTNLTISGIAEGCSVAVVGGASQNSVSTALKQATITSAQAKKNSVVMNISKLLVDRKKVPAVWLRVDKTCNGGTSSSTTSKLAFKTTKGAKTSAAVLKALRKMKVVVPKPTKKRR